MPIVLVTPPQTGPKEAFLIEKMFKKGLLWRLHLRKPEQSKEAHAEYLKHIPAVFHDRIVLHDFHELVDEFDLGGLHYRERLIPTEPIVAPPRRTVSVGFHKPRQVLENRGNVGYCFLSPIFDSISKEGYCPPPELSDRDALREYVQNSAVPVIGLGGVKPSRFSELADMGFSGAALLGSVWNARDPIAALEEALEEDSKTDWSPCPNWPFLARDH